MRLTKFTEQFTIHSSKILRENYEVPEGRSLPSEIYPEIHAITANWVTRNFTYYSAERLIGDPIAGDGARSALYPYNIPIIRDHKESPELGHNASDVYGRVVVSTFMPEAGYLRFIPRITDQAAIAAILDGRMLTVSIGIESEQVICSICRTDQTLGKCEHERGQTYPVNGKPLLCYYELGPIWFRECSFVVVPSDVNAGVINPDLGIQNVRLLAAERLGFPEGSGKHKQFKESSDMPKSHPIVLAHNKETHVTVPLVVFSENAEDTLSEISRMGLEPEQTTIALNALAAACKENEVALPGTLIGVEGDSTEPASIVINENNYALLYHAIDALSNEVKAEASKNTKPETESAPVISEVDNSLMDIVGREKAQLLLDQEDLAKQFAELAKAKEELAKKPAISTGVVEALQKNCLDLYAQAHAGLSRELALLTSIEMKDFSKMEEFARINARRSRTELEKDVAEKILAIKNAIESPTTPPVQTLPQEVLVAPAPENLVSDLQEAAPVLTLTPAAVTEAEIPAVPAPAVVNNVIPDIRQDMFKNLEETEDDDDEYFMFSTKKNMDVIKTRRQSSISPSH